MNPEPLEMLAALDGAILQYEKLLSPGEKIWEIAGDKFEHDGGTRQYYYLVCSCLIATADVDTNAQFVKYGEKVGLEVTVRPAMLWEIYMLQDLRSDDQFVMEGGILDMWEDDYDHATAEAAKGSEPCQYTFEVGPEDGGWVFFSPIKCDHFDSHLCCDLDHLLPDWLSGNEVMECTYDLHMHPDTIKMREQEDVDNVVNFGKFSDAKTLEAVSRELAGLGFVPCEFERMAGTRG